MVTFLGGVALLIVGYFTYGRYIEKNFQIDENRQTPAEALRDGYDFVPMPKWKNGMIELLNIAGTGPIFGPILGALYGPVAYIWIVLGCIFAGAVHDYMIGMISLRNNGAYLPELASRYLGKSMKHVINIFSMLLLILVATVFVVTPANLILSILPAGTPSAVVNQVMLMLLGSVIGTIAIIGVIVLPVSSGLSAFRSLRTIVADYIHVKQDTLPKIFAVTIPLYVISFVLTHVDFNLLWRYFNWANQVTAVIGLLVATRYLILKRRNYWVTFVPAMFMLYAVVVYILSQPIGFNMGLGILTYSLALVLTGILVGLFWKSGQKQLKTVHPEAFLFNDHRPINYYSSLDS